LHDDRELLDLHVRALFTHDARARLLSSNEPWGGGAIAPRLYFGRTRAGNLWRLRAELPEALASELETLCADEPTGAELSGAPRHADAYARLLGAHAPLRGVWAGPAFRFEEYPEPSRELLSVTQANAEVLRGGFEEMVEELSTAQPFVAVVEDGHAVSVCRSVRITPAAHEAGVETLPRFRGRGYALDVTAVWARMVRSAGAEPLYSTSWENTASRSVAKRLRLVQYAADFQVT
jgi:GNAT superfamily N-acetyltransferase